MKNGNFAARLSLLSVLIFLFSSNLSLALPVSPADTIPVTIQLPVKDSIRPPASRKFLAFPFAVRSLETNWGFGGIVARFFKAQKNDSTIRTSDINLLGLYTLNKQLVVVLSSTIFFPKEEHIARFQASYSYYPDKFWGLGNHTAEDAEEPFNQKQFFLNPQFLQRLHGSLYAGLTYEFQLTSAISYPPHGVFDREDIAGREGGNTSGIGPILSWDTRNNAYSPDHGSFAELQFVWFDQHLGSDFNYTVLRADVRKFIHLSQNSVLAVQGLAGLTGGNTPFRYLSELGGSDMMRGYYSGRYTDKCMMAYQVEYRRLLFWRIGGVAFVSTGEVASDAGHFDLDGFHFAAGGGLRFMISKEEKLNIRLDFGVAEHSNAFVVQLREAF